MKKLIIFASALFALSLQIDDHKPCTAEGDSHKSKYESLDRLKNRKSLPDHNDPNASFGSMLHSENQNDLDTTAGAVIEGYILSSKTEHGESCNCHSSYIPDRDVHVNIVASKTENDPANSVIIESTPYSRSLHPEYTNAYFQNLKKQGKKIKISGFLLFDRLHENMITDGKRGTLWEIHPITKIDISPNQ